MKVVATDANEKVLDPVTAIVTGDTWTATLDVSSLADGAITFTATATDPSNNTATATGTATKATVSVTTVPQSLNIAGSKAAVVGGNVEADATVNVVASDADGHSLAPVVATVTGGTRTATIDVSTLDDGPITFTATATDPSNDTATASATSTKTTLTLTTVPMTIGIDNSVATTVGGSVESDATVTVTVTDGDGNSVGPIPATVTGSTWTAVIDVSSLDDGTITYTATATDPSNNTVTATNTAPKTTVSVSPAPPPITLDNESDYEIGGFVESDATVSVVASDSGEPIAPGPRHGDRRHLDGRSRSERVRRRYDHVQCHRDQSGNQFRQRQRFGPEDDARGDLGHSPDHGQQRDGRRAHRQLPTGRP